jgi:hypothetical protein
MKKRERNPEIAEREGWNCIMQMQMQLLLEQLRCQFLPHFADAAGHADAAGDSLSH